MDKRFESHTAEMIVATAQASCPGDPVGTAIAALRMAREVRLPCGIPADWREHSEPMIRHWCQLAGQLVDRGAGQAERELEFAMIHHLAALAAGPEDEAAGPDYPPELETAGEAAQELAEIEES